MGLVQFLCLGGDVPTYRQADLLLGYKKAQDLIAGIDEVGRGSLAGPVVAAAVVLPPDYKLEGLADSKVLTPSKREQLAWEIRKEATAWSIGLVGQRSIDKINILQATFTAMAMAAAKLPINATLLYIDGNKVVPQGILQRFWRKHKSCHLPRQQAIVHGDASTPVISAASIIAKTYRDALMRHLDLKWPQYAFAEHLGYGTRKHLDLLKTYGPCPLHRLSFRGVCQEVPQTKHMQPSLLDALL
ncbi:MAG: ribonuclease HII [Desulfovibrionaceae bacterium]|nr:ribonuclease HII [Desulfovibrionaceae bacterium]